MGYNIGKKIIADGIKLSDLLKGVKKQKEKDELTSIFNRFNENKAEKGQEEILDKNEQAKMFAFFKKLANGNGNDTEVTHKDVRKYNKSAGKGNEISYSMYKLFINKISEITNNGKNNGDVSFSDNSLKISDSEGESNYRMDNGELSSKYDQYGRTIYTKENNITTKYSYSDSNDKDALPTTVIITDNTKKPPVEKTYTKGADNLYTDESGVKYNYADGKFTEAEAEAPVISQPPVEDTTAPAPKEKPVRQNGKRISIPNEWKNQRLEKNVISELKLNETYTADEVLDKLIAKMNIGDDIQKNKLREDLIKYNPSVFNSKGEVYSNADFSKLDIPSNAAQLYKTGDAGSVSSGTRTRTAAPKNPAYIPSKDRTEGNPTAAAPIPKKGYDFTNPSNNSLNKLDYPYLPAPTPSFQHRQSDGSYKVKLNGFSYTYNEQKELISVEGKGLSIDIHYDYKYYLEKKYDNNGNEISRIYRNLKGDFDGTYITFEYNSAGQKTREVSRTANGNVKKYEERTYDSSGKYERDTERTADGKVIGYYDYRDVEFHNPDGTLQTY